MARAKKAGLPPLPAKCCDCGVELHKPKRGTPMGAIRPYMRIRPSGKMEWQCSGCKPPRQMNPRWLELWGDTPVDGWPVDKDKKPCLIRDAVGFRRVNYIDGEKVVKYVRKK